MIIKTLLLMSLQDNIKIVKPYSIFHLNNLRQKTDQHIPHNHPNKQKKMKYIFTLFALILLVACSNEKDSKGESVKPNSEVQSTVYSDYNEKTYESKATQSQNTTYHEDNEYKYEYRTGNSGSYDYNYDIEGYDELGNYVYGNVDISGKYGDGYIYNDSGDEIYIEVEWVGYGELEGYDENGGYYELEAE